MHEFMGVDLARVYRNEFIHNWLLTTNADISRLKIL